MASAVSYFSRSLLVLLKIYVLISKNLTKISRKKIQNSYKVSLKRSSY